MKGKFTKEIAKVQLQLQEITELMKDVKHPEFLQRVSQRNILSVDLEILRQKNEDRCQPQHNCPIYTIPNIN